MNTANTTIRMCALVFATSLIGVIGCEVPLCSTISCCEEPVSPDTDSDSDGIPDLVELSYPTICVADTSHLQQYPTRACSAEARCPAGESCRGLDMSLADSDGDGISDGEEVAGCSPERSSTCTDPRLRDTDGDGIEDRAEHTRCKPNVATPLGVELPLLGVVMSVDPAMSILPARSPQIPGAQGARLDQAGDRYLSGFVAQRSDIVGSVAERATQVGEILRQALRGVSGLSKVALLPESQLPWSWPEAVALRFEATPSDPGLSAKKIRDALLQSLVGESPALPGLGLATSKVLVDVSVLVRAGATVILVAVHGQHAGLDYSDRAQDLVNPQNLQLARSGQCLALPVVRVGQADFVVPEWIQGAAPISFYLDLPGIGLFYRHHPSLQYDPGSQSLRLSPAVASQLKPGQRILLGYLSDRVIE